MFIFIDLDKLEPASTKQKAKKKKKNKRKTKRRRGRQRGEEEKGADFELRKDRHEIQRNSKWISLRGTLTDEERETNRDNDSKKGTERQRNEKTKPARQKEEESEHDVWLNG